MKVVHINNIDTISHIFNGNALHKTMNQMGHQCSQIVLRKYGHNGQVREFPRQSGDFIHLGLRNLENILWVQNLLFTYSHYIQEMPEFKNADIIHQHLLHNELVSMQDLPALCAKKLTVWAIHDPWVITGHCVYPLTCEKWRKGCQHCPDLQSPISISCDNAARMWDLKKKIFSQINPMIIVSTIWRKNLLIVLHTSHWNKIHAISFGIQQPIPVSKDVARDKLGIKSDKTVIVFRYQKGGFKGVDYIIQALERLDNNNLQLLTVEVDCLPPKITDRYNCIELGLVTTHDKMAFFLLPS